MPQTTAEWRRDATEIELRERAAEMRSEWAELSQLDRTSDDYSKGKTQFLAEIEDIDVNLSIRQIESVPPALRRAPAGAIEGPASTEIRTPGQVVTQDEGFRTWMRDNASRDNLTAQSPIVEVRDLVGLGGTSNLLLPVIQPRLIGIDRQRFFLRDLLGSVQVSTPAVPYIRELNSAANATAAEMFQEGGTTPKAEAKIEFKPELAPIGIIAVNIPITTQMLEDSPLIEGYINGRLVYMLKIKEEAELLNGDGTGLNLRGLMNTPGVQTAPAVAGETAQTIGNAIMQVEVVHGYADGVAMHPSDAWSMFMKRAAGGSGEFDAGTPFSDIPMNVWGLPVVRTPAMVAGTALVGAYRVGATVLDRRAANVRVYEQHANFPVLNRVLIQAEERVGLAVERPDWFVKTTVA